MIWYCKLYESFFASRLANVAVNFIGSLYTYVLHLALNLNDFIKDTFLTFFFAVFAVGAVLSSFPAGISVILSIQAFPVVAGTCIKIDSHLAPADGLNRFFQFCIFRFIFNPAGPHITLAQMFTFFVL